MVFFLLAGATAAAGPRIVVPLDGEWRIADGVSPERPPAEFGHRVPVPGLANHAQPPFADVDRFDSREFLANQVRHKLLPESALTQAVGVPRQNRNFFWYTRAFRAPARKQVAILKINKAQFGTAVWLNGKKIGEHTGCFTAGHFDLSGAMDWQAENRLLVRIGAHPAALPPSIMTGIDQEKIKWTPGIYDSVSLLLSDNPAIERIQVAPRPAASEILVQTVLKNYSSRPVTSTLSHRARAWKSRAEAGAMAPRKVALAPGESKTLLDTIRIPNPNLWTPESPFLYVLETATDGDSVSIRFGMREFRFDTATRRAYLNGKLYFPRGSNVTLHRFFEDPKAGALPWTESWVRKLLVEIPKKMHWNSFRFCIGPVPDKWLDIADEAGLLIQNEYFVWTGYTNWHKEWDVERLTEDYREWVRDNWNHPSVVIWDASNETKSDVLARTIVPAVRGEDLSDRPWENGYNLPSGPDDPIEDHPYLFMGNQTAGKPRFAMTNLEQTASQSRMGVANLSGHAMILNEYGWLWLNRDGSPTVLTKGVYENLLGADASAERRFALNAYLLAGLTEYWRAHRNYAAVMHFVYLMCSYPGVYTADHFRDIEKLELEPHFADYVSEAFKPLGVYVDFWRPTLQAGAPRRFTIMMINDDAESREGKLALTLERREGGEAARMETPFRLGPHGQQTYECDLEIPDAAGEFLLKAAAYAGAGRAPTISRRTVTLVRK